MQHTVIKATGHLGTPMKYLLRIEKVLNLPIEHCAEGYLL